MNCESFELRWQELLDERRHPADDELLARHASDCAACRGLLSGCASWFDALPAAPAPKSDLAMRVLAEIQNDSLVHRPAPRATPRRMSWGGMRGRTIAVCFVGAAAILLALWPIVVPPADDQNRERSVADGADPVDQQPEANHPPATSPRATSPKATSLAALARDASNTYLGLARETGQSVSRALSVVPATELSEKASALGLTNVSFSAVTGGNKSAPEPSAEIATGWFEGVTTGLEPISKSTTEALGSLWRSLPEPPREKRS